MYGYNQSNCRCYSWGLSAPSSSSFLIYIWRQREGKTWHIIYIQNGLDYTVFLKFPAFSAALLLYFGSNKYIVLENIGGRLPQPPALFPSLPERLLGGGHYFFVWHVVDFFHRLKNSITLPLSNRTVDFHHLFFESGATNCQTKLGLSRKTVKFVPILINFRYVVALYTQMPANFILRILVHQYLSTLSYNKCKHSININFQL